MSIVTTKLRNGISVITDEVPAAESFTLLVLIRTGSRNETPDIWGISHFLEHMAFKGIPSFPTAELLNKELDSLGAMYNAFTSKEYTGYYVKGSKHIFDRALGIISEMTTSPIILDEEVDRERGTIVEEIHMYEDDPRRKIMDNFEESLYTNLRVSQNVTGTKDSLAGIHAKEIHDYRNKHYVAENLYISIAGAVPAGITNQLEKLFSVVPAAKTAFLPEVAHEVKGVNIEYKDTQQTHMAIGFPGLAMNDSEMERAKLLSIILGGNMSSRMFSEVRERRGLAYYIRTYSDNMYDTGAFATFASVNNEKATEAAKVMMDVYRGVLGNISESELRRAKDFATGMLTLQYEDSEYRSEVNAMMALYEISLADLRQRISVIERITLDQVHAVAAKILDFDRICLSLIGPFKKDEEFAKILESKC